MDVLAAMPKWAEDSVCYKRYLVYMVRTHYCKMLLSVAIMLLTGGFVVPAVAQEPTSAVLYQKIRVQDSLLFDVGFNTCNTNQVTQLLSDNFEFYHDQAGMLKGKDAFISSLKAHVCGLAFKTRRLLDAASMEVFPLYDKDSLYGAVQTGIHRFYAQEGTQPEYLAGKAKFTHLWQLEHGQWKLLRSISYDHRDYAADAPLNLGDSAEIAALLQETKIPGLSIGIISEGKLQAIKVYGELEHGRPVRPNSIFNVASITKTMTAMLVLRLASLNKWDLDEPLAHYYTDPDVAGDPRSRVLTTRHILNQQSGFTNWRYEQPGRRLAFIAAPGTAYHYSGEGFEYLRHALEAKFKLPLDRLADSILFRPLGMQDTHYTWSKQTDTTRMAMPHDASGTPLGFEKNNTPNAADLVTTTIPDLSRFLISVMNGDGLTPPLAAAMVRPTVLTKNNRYVGLCWFIYTPLHDGTYALSHGGDDAGMHTICFLLPNAKKGLVIFTNSDNAPKQLFAALIKTCLKEYGDDIVGIEMK